MDHSRQGRLLEPQALSIAAPSPSAEAQLAFLAKLQRLFAEGDFAATYKFALLIALSDLAVEWARDDGAALALTNRQIADRFIHLYWRHASPYGTGRSDAEPRVLVQNIGAQAAVLRDIQKFRASAGATTLNQARSSATFQRLVGDVARTVSAQPLNFLQNFGGSTDPFLYERSKGGIVLKPGVAYCLRRFYPLIQQLARTHWVDHIKGNRRNRSILGGGDDLEDFLFGTSRQSLAIISAQLIRLEGRRCFYCGQPLHQPDVDHFVPFALYPRDVAHNFVLAHPACNRSKSDSLAARRHLEQWLERLVLRASDLDEIGAAAGVAASQTTAHRVAAWGYANALAAGGRAWLKPSTYESLDASVLRLMDAI